MGEVEKFGNYLRPRLHQMGYETAQLVDTNFIVVATSLRIHWGTGLPVSDAHTNKFAELFASGQPVIITPFKPDLLLRRRTPRPGFNPALTNEPVRANRLQSGNAGRGRRGDVTLMQVAAPVRTGSDTINGALAMIINPDHEFSRILSVARAGNSGETYAFDQTGLMISRSRFDEQLKELGLLERTNVSSALNLRLHDPGGDLTRGYKPTDTDATTRPLIHVVAEAVAGEDGMDLEPSRDYRGVPVIGAWRWLPQLGFGVATQMDAAEAYRPLHVLQLLFVALFLLLVLCAIGMFVFSYSNVVWRKRLDEAELRLKQLGQYTLEEKIGVGGMGVVYRARHALMRRDTAIKLLLPDRATPVSIERFEREVCLTCQLTHPNTIQVYDYGHTPEGIFYYAMEYLRGLNLHDLVARFGVQPEGRVIHILVQICDSLAEAHAVGLIHRDVKPGNVFLCERGGIPDCVKVLDFGLVREFRTTNFEIGNLPSTRLVEGTPWFMPPESIEDPGRADPRSDIYSIGALAYYLLTGQFVFDGESIGAIHAKQLTVNPVPPGQCSGNPVSPALDEIILCCLQVDPDQRPQSALELRALLLASPHAADWPVEQQTAWWVQYNSQLAVSDEATAIQESTPLPNVNIDFESRIS
jgi:serine/threonine protein kinase